MDIVTMSKEDMKKIKKFKKFYNSKLMESLSNAVGNNVDAVMSTDAYKNYLEILKKVAILSKELQLNNSFEVTLLFEYLLWRGYLSKDKQLVYSLSGKVNNPFLIGADIMRGKSVCINNAGMLRDILKQLGKEAYLLGCKCVDTDEKMDFGYYLDLETQSVIDRSNETLKKESFFERKIIDTIGNHAVTLFRENGNYYLSDPTNLLFFNNVDFLKAKCVGGNLELELKIFTTFLYEKLSHEEISNIIDFVCGYKCNDNELTLGYVKDISENTLALCKNNSILLNDFYDDIKYDIDLVCKTLKKRY